MAERVINHETRERFGGTVKRAVLLRSDDEPGQLVVRVFVEAADDEALAGWQRDHQAGIEEFRRELSLRLPSARLLEFTYDTPGGSPGDGPGAARIGVPDDGSLAAEQLSGREIVTKAMELLRANYVFPDEAERAAAAIEARLEAGEYDGLDEITLTDRVTGHLQDITGDKHLRPAGRRTRPAPRTSEAAGPREDAQDGAAGQLRHPPGRAAGRQRRLPRPAPDAGPGQRGPGHHRGHGTRRRDLRAHHRPAAQRRRGAGGRRLLVQLPVRRRADPPQRYLPGRHRRDQAVLGAALRAWQGTGVVPDVAVPEAQAYDVAYARALEHVLGLDDVPPPIADEAREALAAGVGSGR